MPVGWIFACLNKRILQKSQAKLILLLILKINTIEISPHKYIVKAKLFGNAYNFLAF
jgi:hypothetical protein